MTWNSVMGLISTLALFLPIFFIIILRLQRHRSFTALLIYYSTIFTYNLLTEGYIHVNKEVAVYWGLFNNLLDAPLMLYFLTYFSTSKILLRRMLQVIAAYLLFEIIIVAFKGLNVDTITVTLAPGLAITFGYCLFFFVHYGKHSIINRKSTGKAVIVSSLLFAYGCYTIIYLMFYVFKAHLDQANHIRQQYLDDTFLVYFLVVTFSSLLMSAGLLIERKRIQKLAELKVTRKELSSIYADTKKTTPFRAVILDFDQEQRFN
jgi:hypothetical protein